MPFDWNRDRAGVAAKRPAPSIPGREYFSTDTKVLNIEDGLTWTQITAGPSTPSGMLSLLDYGAAIDSNGSPGNGTDDRAAWVSALAAQATTGKPIYVPHGVTGISRISSGITDVAGVYRVIVGQGGKSGFQSGGGQVEVSFDSGGFQFGYGVSGSVQLVNLYVIGNGAPGLWMNNAAYLSLHNTALRGFGAGQPGLQSTDNFYVFSDDDCSFQSGDTSTSAVLIESTSAAGGPEAWDYYLRGRLNNGCVKLDIKGTSGGANLGPIRLTDMVSENANATPLLEVVWESGVTQQVLNLIIDNCNMADSTGACSVLKLTNNSGNTQTAAGIQIRNSPPAGGGNHIQHAGSSQTNTPNALIISNSVGTVGASAGTPNPDGIMTLASEGWRNYGNGNNTTMQEGMFVTDTVSRMLDQLDGTREYGPGGSTARDVRTQRTGVNTWKIKGLAAGTITNLIVDSSDATKDTQLEVFINGVLKGLLYAEHATGEVRLFTATNDVFRAIGSQWAMSGSAPISTPTVSGSRGGNAALASLLTALANRGIIIDGSTA